ncbi:hypothetical protein ACFOUP_18635 [Belliella kenyensis]|uniref:DUF3558 domain-containing protein n=1 Tax=Belliella kenyensis TaxID=1472724 RepID=A0ABV8EQ68_9BACT|nr:hypothetical protein [Belliella kenyensis]MCH7402205.1 hypothetical protein [Belliella kenyensis]MDN3601719.1 hypothetical protein [Belliella kenyensis]
MKKVILPLFLNMILLGLIACGQNQSEDQEQEDTQVSKTSNPRNFNACKGIKESDFREIFKISDDYQTGDVSAFNVMPESSCVLAVGKDGKQLAIMVSLLANPSTFDLVGNRVIEEFKTAPADDQISGLGEFAVINENKTRKESALVVVEQKHVITVALDHSNTYTKEQVKEMLQMFYKRWRSLQN